MSDLKMLSMADAQDFYSTYYAPNNLTAALVGNFDPREVEALARRYFGRIPRGAKPVPDVVTLEVPQLAERRMNAECDCQPQIELLFHTVPFEHRDAYALDVLEGVLNGLSGRLHKSLVLDKKIAASASASQRSLRFNGEFTLDAEAKGDASPADLEAAILAELDRLQKEPVPAEELQKVKNQIAATAFRNLENPFWLMLQLLLYEGWGDWQYVNYWADKTLAVTAEDVQRVAQKYFTAENRTVATYQRKAGAGAEEVPPEIAALPAEMRQRVLAQVRQVRQVTDAKMLEEGLAQLAQQKGAVPPEVKPALEAIEKAMQARLEELRAAAAKP
jgi:predicted Zn-dependent peptidase